MSNIFKNYANNKFWRRNAHTNTHTIYIYMCVCVCVCVMIWNIYRVWGMKLNFSWWRSLRSLEYSFIPITPRSTLTGEVVVVMIRSLCQIDLFKNHSYSIGSWSKNPLKKYIILSRKNYEKKSFWLVNLSVSHEAGWSWLTSNCKINIYS